MAKPKRPKKPHAVALGRLGGLKAAGAGLAARYAGMTPEERRELAHRPVEARSSTQAALRHLLPQ
jgi:hypothetical protein